MIHPNQFKKYLENFKKVAAILIVATFLSACDSQNEIIENGNSSNLESFVNCLNEKGVIMYGNDVCKVCTSQKRVFGKLFENINYVNCTFNQEECNKENIKAFPTWKINGNNKYGLLSVKDLSDLTNCKFINN